MHLVRPVGAGVGYGGAAGSTKIALNARRGGIGRRFARKVAELLATHADIGRERRGHGTAAVGTMAVHHPLRRPLELVGDGAALATTPGGAHGRKPSAGGVLSRFETCGRSVAAAHPLAPAASFVEHGQGAARPEMSSRRAP